MGGDSNPLKLQVMLINQDVAASIGFYRDKLGFTLEGCWPSEEKPMWASLALGGQTVMLGCEAHEDMCGDTPEGEFFMQSTADFRKAPGGGVTIYIGVPDVDAYHAELTGRGVAAVAPPKDQFYGQRDFPVHDLDGYRLYFFSPITMSSCQSCGMPLQDAKEGDMYCDHCTNEHGHLRPFAEVLEGTTVGYFMGMQKMERAEAEQAAREHLGKLPAWSQNC